MPCGVPPRAECGVAGKALKVRCVVGRMRSAVNRIKARYKTARSPILFLSETTKSGCGACMPLCVPVSSLHGQSREAARTGSELWGPLEAESEGDLQLLFYTFCFCCNLVPGNII